MKDEILQKYQIRKSNKQKDNFIAYLKERLKRANYNPMDDIRIEQKGHGIFRSKNIIVGDIEKADIIFTAHYDTCAVLPFPNIMAPLNTATFIGSQIVLAIIILLLCAVAAICGTLISESPVIGYYSGLIFLYLLLIHMFIGFRNPHTANDNTSGVIALTKILEVLPPESRKKLAVVYFDNEEKGLFGSAFFAKKHKNIKKNGLIINVDCIGDGDTVTFLAKTAALNEDIYKSFLDSFMRIKNNHDIAFIPQKVKPMMFPSDQINFKKGVGVCAVNKTPIGHLVWRIHTPFDTICKEENINFFVEGALDWAGRE